MKKLTDRQREVLEKMNQGWGLARNFEEGGSWLFRGAEQIVVNGNGCRGLLSKGFIVTEKEVTKNTFNYQLTEKGREVMK